LLNASKPSPFSFSFLLTFTLTFSLGFGLDMLWFDLGFGLVSVWFFGPLAGSVLRVCVVWLRTRQAGSFYSSVLRIAVAVR
jgi:hypothetical protein